MVDGVRQRRYLARIERVDAGGGGLRTRGRLCGFAVTLLDAPNSPRRVMVRQFVPLPALARLVRGRYVVVALATDRDPTDPKAKWLVEPDPPPEYAEMLRTAPERYRHTTAPVVEEPAPLGGFGRIDHGFTPLRLLVGSLVMAVGLTGGVLAAAALSPMGAPRLITWVSLIPDRITGDVTGLWDSPELSDDIETLQQRFEGRQILSVGIYGGSISVSAVATSDPEGEDDYAYRHGSLSRTYTSSRTQDGSFSMDLVSAKVIEKAVAQVYAKNPDADISGVRLYLSMSAPGTPILSISVEGEYDVDYFEFDSRTGEELVPD